MRREAEGRPPGAAPGRGAIGRRAFLGIAGSCAAHLGWGLAGGTAAARALFAARPVGPVAAREPWGRIERVAEGAWALVSTPLAGGDDAARTFSNGGIVAGRSGVLLVEGTATEEGARWLAASARELTGRTPTHVVLTHYHGDHSRGLGEYETGEGAPLLVSTDATREALAEAARRRGGPSPALAALQGERVELVGEAPAVIDLGGRRVRITPRAGHTASDLDVVLEEPRIVWCGDLVWNGLFPNYMDATPSVLAAHVARLVEEPARVWVPGHGSLMDAAALARYRALLDDVEAAARRAAEDGTPSEAAAADYRPPASLGEWTRFSPRYHAVAFEAWMKELAP